MNSWIHTGLPRTAGTTFQKNSLMKAATMLGAILLWMGILLFVNTVSVSAQVSTLQDWTNVYNGTSTSAQTATFTVPAGTGSNRLLVVAIASNQTGVGSRTVSLTYGTRALTLATGDMGTTTIQQHTAIYYLKETDLDLASSTTLAFTVSGGTTRATTVWWAAYDFVDQTTPITNSRNYNGGTTATSSFQFGTALTVNAGNQAVLVVSNHRLGSTNLRTTTYPTNFTMVNEQTTQSTDAVRNGVAKRSIPGTNTTDLCATTFSNSALASMTGASINSCTQPTANAGSALSAICKGGTSAALGGSVGGSATGGTWSDGGAGGSFSPNATTLNATYTPASSYTGNVTLTLTTSGGSCSITSASKILVVNPVPTSVTASSSASSVCTGGLVNLTSSATSNSGTAATLINENFNVATNNWVKTNNTTGGTATTNGNAAWVLYASGSTHGSTSPEAITSNDNSQFYFTSSDSTGAATVTTNTILESPAFSTVGLNAASLSFFHYYKDYDANDSIRVLISTDGGTNWTRIYLSTSTVGAANAFVNQVISLNSYLGFANVKLRFNYSAKWGWFWNVDNVSVTGTYTAAPAATFAWTSSPSGFTSALQNPSGVSVSVNTVYTVTATNSYGCTATNTASVTSISSITAPAGTAGSRCGTGTVSISATPGSGETIDWYAAASGGAVLAGGTGVTTFTTPSISATTNYFAQARNTTTGCLSESRTSVAATINPIPTISNQSSSSVYGTATTYTITATNAASFSAASLPTGITLNTATGVLTIAADCPVGVYSISVSVSSSAGCNGAAAATVTYTRNKKALTITGATTTNKEYDGNTSAAVTGGTLVGLVGADVVDLTQSGTFATKTVGTNKAITSTCSISGANAGNYTLTQPTLTARNITAKSLTVTGAVASNKVYNGNTTATITGGSLVGVISPDVVNLTQAGTFVDKNVGTGKAVTASCSLSGTDAANYSITQPTGLTADITPAALTVTASNQVKCYGYNFSLGTTSFTSSGLGSGDAIASVTLNSDGADLFADPGTYPIIPSDATGASFSAANYNITYVNGTLTVSDIPSFSVDPSADAQTLCLNGTVTALNVSASPGSGTISSYQWYINTAASSFGGTLILGATSATYTPSSATAGVFYYYCVVTNSFGCSLPSNVSGAITINALPTIVTVTGGGTVCNNTLLTASNGASGTIYYQGSTSNGISTATPSTSELISVTGTYYFRALSAEGCWGPQGSAAVVIQAPIVTGVEICQGAAAGSMSTSFTCNALNNQTSGPNDATVGSNVTGVGTLAWTNPGNIAGAGTAGMTVNANTTTNYLRGTGYGFAIPSTAVINGITVSVSRSSSSTSTTTNLRDNEVKLVKAGTIQSTNKASATLWGNLATVTYGGAADLWSTTWTPSDINNANFGVVLSILNTNTNTTTRNAAVDFIRVTVTYSIAGSLDWYTVSSGGTSIGSGSSFNPVGVSGSGISNTNTSGTIAYYVECRTNPGCRGSANYVINALPTAPAAGNAARCGTGTVDISATPASGETIDWYAAASGGTALLSSSTSFTTPSISATTVYYAEARNIDKGCVSASRTAVTATVKSATTSSTDISVCDSYSWNGNTYTNSGTYSYVTTNAAGCDSTATLNLTITTSSSNTSTVNACDSYVWAVNGQTYTTSGTYTDVDNCHTEILELTISASTSNTTVETACSQYTWSVNSQTYTTSGVYTSVTGCATEILELTIKLPGTLDTTVTVCGSYTLNGNTYSASGDYTQQLTAVNGCDSTIQLHLTVNPLPEAAGAMSGVVEVCNLVGSSTPTTYSVAAVAGATSYNWIVPTGVTIVSGQGTNSIGVTFVNTLAATNQKIRVFTINEFGCQSAVSSFITLTKTVPGIPTISGPTNPCPFVGAGYAEYTCDSIPSANSYLWTAPNGASIVSGQGTRSIQVNFTSSFTLGSIGVTALSNCGNRAQRTYTLTRLTPSAPVAISGPTSACTYMGNSQQATYSIAPVANATSYTWTVPANVTIVSGQGTTSIVVTFGGNYVTSNFKVKSVSNCFTSSDRQLSVTAATYAAPGAISGPTNACFYVNNDATATYTIRKVPNAPDYIWTVPAGVTIVSHPGGTGANDTSIAVTFNSNFVFGTRILVQTTGCGTSSATGLTITGTVVSMPNVISGPTNVCQFMVSSSNPNGNLATYTIRKVSGATYYTWNAPSHTRIVSHPAGTGINDTIVQVKYDDDFVSGSVGVKAGNACGSSTTRSLTISRLNVATPSNIDVQMISDCPSRVFKYALSSMPLQATTVIWTVPEGATIISGQGTTTINVSYPPSAVGGFVTAQGINNCSGGSIRIRQIKLQACPSSFTSTEPTTSKGAMVASEEMTVSVYPNPTTTAFRINLNTSSNEVVKVRVMDMQGRMVKNYTLAASQQMSFGNDLKAGSYMVEFIQGNKKKVQRLMKF